MNVCVINCGIHTVPRVYNTQRYYTSVVVSNNRPTNDESVICLLFLHDRPWILPWIKSISNELDVTCHVFASQLSGHCDVIASRLWRHLQNVQRASETRGWCVKILVLAPFIDPLCHVTNKIMYVLSWRTVSALTRVLFWCLFPSLLRNSGNKHQNNPLVSAKTVRHASTYIILYILRGWK